MSGHWVSVFTEWSFDPNEQPREGLPLQRRLYAPHDRRFTCFFLRGKEISKMPFNNFSGSLMTHAINLARI